MLVMLGAGHRDLDLDELGLFGACADGLERELTASPAINGAIVLATCNRFELYLDTEGFHAAADDVRAVLARRSERTPEAIRDALAVRIGRDVVAHLFAVAAGLDSMVMGDAEVSGQVARALERARDQHTTTPQLERLAQAALHCSKRIAATTELGAQGRSTAVVAIDIAAQIAKPPCGGANGGRSPASALVPECVAETGSFPQTVLLVGTGAIARVSAAALRARGTRNLLVYSPSGRAEAFARTHDATVVEADVLTDALVTADVVVTCSGRVGGIFEPAALEELLERRLLVRPETQLPVVDLSAPGDVPAAARALPGLAYIGLAQVAEAAPKTTASAIDQAAALVDADVAAFVEDQAERLLDPAVVALRRHVKDSAARELDRLRNKYDAQVASEFERSLHRVTQALLHTPSVRARECVRNGAQVEYLKAVHVLFGIDMAADCARGGRLEEASSTAPAPEL